MAPADRRPPAAPVGAWQPAPGPDLRRARSSSRRVDMYASTAAACRPHAVSAHINSSVRVSRRGSWLRRCDNVSATWAASPPERSTASAQHSVASARCASSGWASRRWKGSLDRSTRAGPRHSRRARSNSFSDSAKRPAVPASRPSAISVWNSSRSHWSTVSSRRYPAPTVTRGPSVRPGPAPRFRTLRQPETYVWTTFTADAGGRSPHIRSTRVSTGTTAFACSASTARSPLRRAPAGPHSCPAWRTSNGPRTPTCSFSTLIPPSGLGRWAESRIAGRPFQRRSTGPQARAHTVVPPPQWPANERSDP